MSLFCIKMETPASGKVEVGLPEAAAGRDAPADTHVAQSQLRVEAAGGSKGGGAWFADHQRAAAEPLLDRIERELGGVQVAGGLRHLPNLPGFIGVNVLDPYFNFDFTRE